jgi:hypothetical protein
MTNMTKMKISYDFVCQRVNLSWRDVKFALGHQFVKPQFAINNGMERLCTSDNVSSDEIELAGCTGNDSILELVNRLADADQTASDEVEAKWLYLVLAWLFENRETMNDPLGIIEELYADFGYPHEISPFVRYMPMVGPALENREQNEARLYEYWKRYLDEVGKYFALIPQSLLQFRRK